MIPEYYTRKREQCGVETSENTTIPSNPSADQKLQIKRSGDTNPVRYLTWQLEFIILL